VTPPLPIVPVRAELLAYEAAHAGMLPEHEGEYVVIKGDAVLRFFTRYDEALEWAYEQFGLEPFFVKRVAGAGQDVVHFTRDIGPCRS
jgi:hypothetical protein